MKRQVNSLPSSLHSQDTVGLQRSLSEPNLAPTTSPQAPDGRAAEAGQVSSAGDESFTLRRIVFGYYWPICEWLRLVTDQDMKTAKPARKYFYRALLWAAYAFTFVQFLKFFIFVMTTIYQKANFEPAYTTILCYQTIHGVLSRLQLHRYVADGNRCQKMFERMERFVRSDAIAGTASLQQAFAGRTAWFNLACVALLLMVVGNSACFVTLNILELAVNNATEPMMQPVARIIGANAVGWIAIDAIGILLASIFSALLVINLALRRMALSKAVETLESKLDKILEELRKDFDEAEAFRELGKLHLSVAALLELASATFGGNAKDAFRITFWCALGIITPAQSVFPYVWRAKDPLHVPLVLLWLIVAVVMLIVFARWLISPLKSIAKMNRKLRLEEAFNRHPSSEVHSLVNRIGSAINEAGVRPLSFKNTFFSLPSVMLVIFCIPFFVFVLNLPVVKLPNPTASAVLA